MRREERVTVQGPVKKQQPDGMSHRGGGDFVWGFREGEIPAHLQFWCGAVGRRKLQHPGPFGPLWRVRHQTAPAQHAFCPISALFPRSAAPFPLPLERGDGGKRWCVWGGGRTDGSSGCSIAMVSDVPLHNRCLLPAQWTVRRHLRVSSL